MTLKLNERAGMSDSNQAMTNEIAQAVALLRAGEVVAFPTETVYGLGADALTPTPLAKIFHLKGRPVDHPLIVHLGASAEVAAWAREVPEVAKQLMQAFWPGPLTLILRKQAHVSDFITGGQDTVGLRMPAHPVAQALLQAYGSGLAAPSANRFGRLSPTDAAAVTEELGFAIKVLDGGRCAVGVESTIVDVSGGAAPVILRPGMISPAAIAAVLGQEVLLDRIDKPRVSGSLASHYAPLTPLVLVTKADIASMSLPLGQPCGLLLHSPVACAAPMLTVVKMSDYPDYYARELYFALRELDRKKLCVIYVEAVPENYEWDALRDRLQRACAEAQGL